MKVLIVEDDLGLSELVREIIEECGFQSTSVYTAGEAMKWLKVQTPDLMILDYSLPDMNGKEFINILQNTGKTIPPFIISTGQGDENIAVDMMKLGAKDYLTKNNYFLSKLPEVLKRIDREIENENKRKLADEALHNERTLLRTIIDLIPDAIYIKDIYGRKTLANPKEIQLSGMNSEEEIIGKTDSELFPDDKEQLFNIEDEFVLNCGEPILDIETKFIDKAGKLHWLLGSKVPLRDANGQICGIVGLNHDITELKRAEEEKQLKWKQLARQQEILAEVATSPFTSEGDIENLTCFLTELVAKYMGVERVSVWLFNEIETQLRCVDLFELSKNLHSSGAILYEVEFNNEFEALKNNKYVDVNDPLNDPRTAGYVETYLKPCKISAMLDSVVRISNRNLGTLCIEHVEKEHIWTTEEINFACQLADQIALTLSNRERKTAAVELRKLSSSVEQSPVSIFITNIRGNISYINPKFTEVTGFTLMETLGKNPKFLKSGEQSEEFYKNLWDTILSGKIWQGEFHNKKKNGELYWENAIISPILDDNGSITHFVALKEDITEKKKMIDDLVVSKELAEQSNKLKDAFIANMSHEIRTPLNGILGMTSIISEIFSEYITDEEEKYFAAVEKSCFRITRTVDMILNYSRLQVGAFTVKPDEVELSSICERLAKEFDSIAKMRSLEFFFVNKIGKATITVDKYSITQSISSLIDNAIKYTKAGFVKVILDKGVQGEIIVAVEDSGVGISEDYLPHIFEPYSQEHVGYGRAYEGVGLGLAIVKKILDLNGANISVTSKKEEGSTFSINFGKMVEKVEEDLPQIQSVEINKNLPYIEPPKSTKQSGKKRRLILMVEDDKTNQEIVGLFIKKNFDVIITPSSDEVLGILRKNEIDIILMDISIEGSKNGLELAKELKALKEYMHIPIIAVTAHAFTKDRDNSFAAGCNDYISKPFTKGALLNKIEQLMQSS